MKKKETAVVTSIALPSSVLEAVRLIAEEEGTSVSWIIRRFVKHGLETYRKKGHL